MIKIRESEGRRYPSLLCDICGEPITKDTPSHAAYNEDHVVKIHHKQCDSQLETPPKYTTPLPVFMVQLVYNAGIIDWQAALEHEERYSGMY